MAPRDRHRRRMDALAGGLFVANAAITGEFNYQGGDRKTFYSRAGFHSPTTERRSTTSARRSAARSCCPATCWRLGIRSRLRHNMVYFVVGRFCGLLPYFFPGVLSTFLFLARKREPWQWLMAATIVAGGMVLLVLTPFTYSGGGGPVGNRYFLSFYPLFLFLTPPLAGIGAAAAALGVGALFTAKILLNPFYSSFNPGEHAKTGPLRWLPIELTLLNDLPMAANPDRMKRPLGGYTAGAGLLRGRQRVQPRGRCVLGSKGKSRAEVILRAPVVDVGRAVRDESDRRAEGRIQNGADRRRHDLHRGRIAYAGDESAEKETVRSGRHQRTAVHAQRASDELLYACHPVSAGFVPFLIAPGTATAASWEHASGLCPNTPTRKRRYGRPSRRESDAARALAGGAGGRGAHNAAAVSDIGPPGPARARRQQRRSVLAVERGMGGADHRRRSGASVRVEQMHRIGDDGPRHPCHVPQRKLTVAAVGAGVPARVDRYRIQQQRRERRARQHHQPVLAPRHSPAGLVCHVVVSASAYSGTSRTRAPRKRLSLLPGTSRNGTKPALARIDTG